MVGFPQGASPSLPYKRSPSAQDDACLAELSLALSVSLDVSLAKPQLQSVALGVWGLHAELHEGLFHSELLRRMGGRPGKGAGEDPRDPRGRSGWAVGNAVAAPLAEAAPFLPAGAALPRPGGRCPRRLWCPLGVRWAGRPDRSKGAERRGAALPHIPGSVGWCLGLNR